MPAAGLLYSMLRLVLCLQVPKLLKPPLHATALRAIGSLSDVAGNACTFLMGFDAFISASHPQVEDLLTRLRCRAIHPPSPWHHLAAPPVLGQSDRPQPGGGGCQGSSAAGVCSSGGGRSLSPHYSGNNRSMELGLARLLCFVKSIIDNLF